MGEENWVDGLELPKTEAMLLDLISSTERLLANILIVQGRIDVQTMPEQFQRMSESQEEAERLLENFHFQLANRRRLMGDMEEE
jgi:hypothetical protein